MVGFAESVNLPADQIKYVSALLAGIPIGLVFRVVTVDPFGKEVRRSRLRTPTAPPAGCRASCTLEAAAQAAPVLRERAPAPAPAP